MSNQTVKQTWWPIICAIFYLPFIVFFYVGIKYNDKKWLAIGALFLVLLIAFFAVVQKYQNALWLQVIATIYWISGLVLTHYSWKTYLRENQG